MKHYHLCNIKLTGECAFSDHEVAEMFPAQLVKLVDEKGYLPKQVFNADETSLFLKKIANTNFYLEA